MSAIMTPVRLTLKEARTAKGLTQSELADKVGVRQATISDLESGKSGRIDFDLLDKLCDVLDVEVAELVQRDSRKRRR